MKAFILITLTFVGMVGCGNSSNRIVDPPLATNKLKALALQAANTDVGTIEDAGQLKTDINALFNAIDPVEVEAGDKLEDVINRAEGS